MTPLQFAKSDCANYEADGSCAGIGIRDDGSRYSFGKKPVCSLMLDPPICLYFEQCVLPIGTERNTAERVAMGKERDEANWLYYKASGRLNLAKKRKCPICGQRELEPRARMCYVCRAKQRRKSYSKANEARVTVQQLSEKTPQNPSENDKVSGQLGETKGAVADPPKNGLNCCTDQGNGEGQ